MSSFFTSGSHHLPQATTLVHVPKFFRQISPLSNSNPGTTTGHQAKKSPLIPKPVLRKRRSFKRQASQFGRGKQPSLLQAMAAEHDASEEQNAMSKVEAAKTSAKVSVESAIVKRRQAQRLMENADLAIYKATMALRIAEAARLENTTDAAVSHFLD